MINAYLQNKEWKVIKMLGNNIKELRKAKRMTQKELADTLHVSQQTVGSWETERAIPGADTLAQLADYFGVTTDYLLGRKEDSKTKNDDKQVDLTGIGQKEDEEKIFSYEGKEIPKQDLELIRRILETGEYNE